MSKKKRKLSKTGKIIVTVFVCVCVALVAILAYTLLNKDQDSNEVVIESTPEVTSEVVTATMDPDAATSYDEIYDTNYAINEDYVAYLEWENGLLYDYDNRDEYPHIIVRSKIVDDGEGDVNAANSEYLRANFIHEYTSYGQDFIDGDVQLDENNRPTSQNIIIYGHNVEYDDTLKFTPLHTLEDASVYEDYDTFTLTFYKQQRTYQVTDVFIYDKSLYTSDSARTDTPFAPEYTDEQLETLMDNVKNEWTHYVDTGITIDSDDNFVTLQTCVTGDDNLLFVVFGVEIDRVTWE